MTDDRFNALVNGPLDHPLIPFKLSRLALALRAVVEATGEQGAAALEAHCAARQAQDGGFEDEGPIGDEDDLEGFVDPEELR